MASTTTGGGLPEVVQEQFMDALIRDVQANKLVSAAALARTILRLGQTVQLQPSLRRAAERTADVLERRGYSEEQFMRQVQTVMQRTGKEELEEIYNEVGDARDGVTAATVDCGPHSAPRLADGLCPPGYSLVDGCCSKTFMNKINSIDHDNLNLATELPTPELKNEFAKRFLLDGNPEYLARRNAMLVTNVTPHMETAMKRYGAIEELQVESKTQDVLAGRAKAEDSLGISDALFRAICALVSVGSDVAGLAARFAKWYVMHDWTYWWIGIYIFRFISLFGCMALRAMSASLTFESYIAEITWQWFGLKPVYHFLTSAMDLNVLAVLAITSMLSHFSRGVINLAGGMLMTVLGLTQFQAKIMSWLSLPGFSLDAAALMRDVFYFGKDFSSEFKSIVMSGGTPSEGVRAALVKSLEVATRKYCDTRYLNFVDATAAGMGDSVISLFQGLCTFIGYIPLVSPSSAVCKMIVDQVNSAMQAWRASRGGDNSVGNAIGSVASNRNFNTGFFMDWIAQNAQGRTFMQYLNSAGPRPAINVNL